MKEEEISGKTTARSEADWVKVYYSQLQGYKVVGVKTEEIDGQVVPILVFERRNVKCHGCKGKGKRADAAAHSRNRVGKAAQCGVCAGRGKIIMKAECEVLCDPEGNGPGFISIPKELA